MYTQRGGTAVKMQVYLTRIILYAIQIQPHNRTIIEHVSKLIRIYIAFKSIIDIVMMIIRYVKATVNTI